MAKREPTQPPEVERRIQLRPLQWVGMLLLLLVPILGVAGVIGPRADAIEMIWRVAFVFAFLMMAFRFTGKRELGEMSPFELVTLLLIPEIFSSALNRSDDSMTHATVGVSLLFVLVFVAGLLTYRSSRVEKLLDGGPTILVRNGKLQQKQMAQERLTPEELFTEMHKSGIARLEQVRWAILESDGKISIITKDGVQHRHEDEPHRV